MPALITIDELGVAVAPRYALLENVGVVGIDGQGRVGVGDAEQVAKVVGEGLGVGGFGGSGGGPFFDEGARLHGQ